MFLCRKMVTGFPLHCSIHTSSSSEVEVLFLGRSSVTSMVTWLWNRLDEDFLGIFFHFSGNLLACNKLLLHWPSSQLISLPLGCVGLVAFLCFFQIETSIVFMCFTLINYTLCRSALLYIKHQTKHIQNTASCTFWAGNIPSTVTKVLANQFRRPWGGLYRNVLSSLLPAVYLSGIYMGGEQRVGCEVLSPNRLWWWQKHTAVTCHIQSYLIPTQKVCRNSFEIFSNFNLRSWHLSWTTLVMKTSSVANLLNWNPSIWSTPLSLKPLASTLQRRS